MAKTKASPSPLRAYVDEINDLPSDVLLGRIVLFKITDEPVRHDDIVQWFTELQLDAAFLPTANKYVDAFKKATSAIDGEKYPMSQERTGHVLSRDLGSTRDIVRRQITREIKDSRNKRLSYDAAIECTFFRPSDPKNQSTAGLRIVVRPEALEHGELGSIRAIARDIRDRYERFYEYLDGQKLRGTVRDYLKNKLNAIEIKGGVYFVHASRDDELGRLATLVDRFGGGCRMNAIPMVDLKRERELIIEEFEREASQSLRDITKEAKELLSSGRQVTATSYARLKTAFDEVMGNAEEHMINLQMNQDVTAAAAEVAFNTLRKLQEGDAPGVIDLSRLRSVLAEVSALVNDLDGKELDDTDAVTSQSKGEARKIKAQRSQDLQLLATRLELGAALVRNEYWYARGEVDPLNRRRD